MIFSEEQKEKRRKDSLEYYHQHRDKIKIIKKKYRSSPKGKAKCQEYDKYYRTENREKIRERQREYQKRNRVEISKLAKVNAWKRKVKVLYKVNPTLKCELCGENDIRVLQINHINGRVEKRTERATQDLFGDILNNRTSLENLNLLCANCNLRWEHEYRNLRYSFLPKKPYTKKDINFWEIIKEDDNAAY